MEIRMRKIWNATFESCVLYTEFPYKKIKKLFGNFENHKRLKIRVMVQNLFQPKVRQHLHYTWAELTIYANTISGLNHP